jgi:replicative DNA helicase
VGEVKLRFLEQYGRFESLSTIYTSSDLPPSDEYRANRAADNLEQSQQRPPEPPLNPDDAPF